MKNDLIFVLRSLLVIGFAYLGLIKNFSWAANVLMFYVIVSLIFNVIVLSAMLFFYFALESFGKIVQKNRDLRVPLGASHFLAANALTSVLLAACGAFWLAGLYILSAVIQIAYIELLTPE